MRRFIVHVCRTGWPVVGGMETAIHGLARAQVAAGHRVEVVTLQYALDDGRGLPHVDHDGVRYRRVHRLGPKRYPFAYGLRRAVQGADVVHVHGIDGLADRLVRANARPLVGISTHGGYLHSQRNRWVKQAMLRTVTRRTMFLAEAVWFTSEVDRLALAPAGIRGQVVPNGVAIDSFLDVHRAPEPGLWVVLGRVDRHKGLDRLFDALAFLPESVRIEVIGPDAGSMAHLERRLARMGHRHRVRFRGSLEPHRVAQTLGRAELALFPSRHEAFGIAVVEAMAAGAPVAVSGIDAHRALVDDGRTGFVVDYDEPRGVAHALQRLSGEAERVSDAARTAARAHGWDRRIGDWERAYSDLLACRMLAG